VMYRKHLTGKLLTAWRGTMAANCMSHSSEAMCIGVCTTTMARLNVITTAGKPVH